MAHPLSIPVTILTGFLGSGKTTFLNRLLKKPQMAEALVLVNEFGEVGLDHLLIEAAEDTILELSNGCLCCTIRGELVDRLTDILTRIEEGHWNKPSRLIIETTGLADPLPILQLFIAHPLLLQSFSHDRLIVMVDAVNGLQTLENYEEARRQVALADRIFISKADLLAPAEDLNSLTIKLKTLNKLAEILTLSPDTEADIPLFQGGLFQHDFDPDYEDEYEHHHNHHDHDKNRHSQNIVSFCLSHDKPLPITLIEAFLGILRETYGAQILRLKGFVATLERSDAALIIQAAQGLFHPPQWRQDWPTPSHQTRLVAIVDGIKREEIEALFGSFTGQIGVDMADAAALHTNPLAISGLTFPPSRSGST